VKNDEGQNSLLAQSWLAQNEQPLWRGHRSHNFKFKNVWVICPGPPWPMMNARFAGKFQRTTIEGCIAMAINYSLTTPSSIGIQSSHEVNKNTGLFMEFSSSSAVFIIR